MTPIGPTRAARPHDIAPAPPLAPPERRGVYRAIFERRDVRADFLPDRVPAAVLARVLAAAHHAPSVGFMQPWNFVVVRDRRIRARVLGAFRRERARAMRLYTGSRRARFASLKLEGILDAPLNICVTCDSTRGGPSVLGRSAVRETDLYSACCAVQNLWLAARAEGVGVGWVSIVQPAELSAILGLPARVVSVAYLSVGYVSRFPARPDLEAARWRRRLRLERLVFGDRWGKAPGARMTAALRKASRA